MPVGIGSQAKQQRWGRGSGRRGAGATTADEASTRAHPAPPNLKKGSWGAGGGRVDSGESEDDKAGAPG